jgi:hypothetical protein
MSKEKRKKPFSDLFGFEEDLFPKPGSLSTQGGSGYSISVTYDEKNKPVVKVQTHGEINAAELRRDIEQRYPGAKIEGLESQPLIRIVGEEPASEKKESKNKEKEKKGQTKKKKQPLIRVVE